MVLDQKRLVWEVWCQAEYHRQPYIVSVFMFPIEKMQILPIFNLNDVASTVLAIDKAGTVSDTAAYTAIVTMHKMRSGAFVIEHVMRGRWGALERERIIKEWADFLKGRLSRLGTRFTVVIEVEPGSGGKESAEATIRNLAGHICIGDKPGAGRSKAVRAEPFAAQCQSGNVYLHAGSVGPGFP
jgi:phage terminase large subunit-like protein